MNYLHVLGASIPLFVLALVTQPAAAYHSKHRHHILGPYQTVRIEKTHRNRHAGGCRFTNDGREVCGGPKGSVALISDANANSVTLAANEGTIVGARPTDCPRSYCGCGLRKYLGLSDTRLNLAANWARLFPRESAPRPGLAAVRNHHVMYIEAAAENGQWLIRDYNSGGGLSRVHVSDVHGYAFVNPHAQLATR